MRGNKSLLGKVLRETLDSKQVYVYGTLSRVCGPVNYSILYHVRERYHCVDSGGTVVRASVEVRGLLI